MLFHLGVLPRPPADPRRRPGLGGHYSGVAEPLRGLLLDYCAQTAATRAPATVKAIASHLAGFGRFLSACDPPVTDLAALDRRAHIEPWLASLAAARHPDGRAHSIGHRRGQILTVRQFLADITEWGWPAAPARPLLFARDVPDAPHPLPRYLPPDADRRLVVALEQRSASGPSPLARLHADALLLTRATGLRLGELRDLELDCVHQIDGHGAWLKVPLGKLGTERMVPLDDETLDVLDRIVARRTPSRALPHPRTGRPTEFLLVHQGRRVSAQALRDELARTAQAAGLGTITPHALRHTYATALVNAGVSLQALMQLLGHVSAAMSLRYGRLFDTTVRAEYERALTQAKAALTTASPAGAARAQTLIGWLGERRRAAAAGRHHRRPRLARHPHDQVPAGRRVLPARARPGILRLCQHLRALPELPHRRRLPRRARRPTRRRRRARRGRRRPRLGRRSRPAPPPRRPARPADHPRRNRMTDIHPHEPHRGPGHRPQHRRRPGPRRLRSPRRRRRGHHLHRRRRRQPASAAPPATAAATSARSSTATAPATANCSPSPGWPTASTTSPKPSTPSPRKSADKKKKSARSNAAKQHQLPGQRESRPPISRIIEEQQVDLEVEQVRDLAKHPALQLVADVVEPVHRPVAGVVGGLRAARRCARRG